MDDISLAFAARRELRENILPFWRQRTVDQQNGGFIAEMSNDLRIRENSPKGLILNARLLWTFSAADRYTGEEYRFARRAYEYLSRHFRDREHGGYFWEVKPKGAMLDGTKKIYGQAFVIYALAEYCRTYVAPEGLTRCSPVDGSDERLRPQVLQEAVDLFQLIEAHARDPVHGGYVETLSRDWTPCEDVRLSEKDMNEKKSMNNHLHLLEAYTNLLRVWPDEHLASCLRDLIDIFRRRILNAAATHFNHFFDESWTPKSDSYTFGHDIEGSWLLCEAADVLGDPSLQVEVRETAVSLAYAALREGLDADGGLWYEARNGQITDGGKEWWPQAEAVVGFYNAWQMTRDPAFRDAAIACWYFIQDHVVDKIHGEWFWRIRTDGTPDPAEPKVSAWKCPYHNSRCCLELIHRAKHENSHRSQA